MNIFGDKYLKNYLGSIKIHKGGGPNLHIQRKEHVNTQEENDYLQPRERSKKQIC